jgi:uncharacterized SAM-binding protein YcdF (DUF218 family)
MTRRNSCRFISLAVALVLLVAAVIGFRGAGHWLIREDPLGLADAIVVLSGSMPARAEEAAEIFRMGYAHEVWVSRPGSPGAELAEMGVRYAGEEDYNREVLIHLGVPETNIQIFPHEIADTEQEVEEVTSLLASEGKTSAIIVTSMQHTRRVRALWQKLAARNQRMIVRATPQDSFDANHWWRNTHDLFSVLREILGLINAWTGLPVRPPNT